MEITDFAKNVLLSSALENKLFAPEKLTDKAACGYKDSIHAPSRSKNIMFGMGRKLPFPKTEHLADPDKKAQVFHFFANHELLAMELMALLLLKFPEAPKAFRRGIAQAMLEEQTHMQLYLKQMRTFGVEFGDFHLNNFFWKSLAPIQSIKNFVVNMSLTFEQANLDFSKHFMTEFAKLNDSSSYAVMKQVYEDEIGHVKLGVHWLNKWKDDSQSLWEAYSNELSFPLTPERGKGKHFDRDGRIKAGLTEDFIENIYLFNTSKERPPRVWYFNPEAEEELLASSNNYTPNKALREIKNSLQHFLCISAIRQDIIAVNQAPSKFFLEHLKHSPLPSPEFFTYSNSNSLAKELSNHLGDRKIISLNPWAHTQSTLKIESQLKNIILSETTEASSSLIDKLKTLNSQIFSLNLLKQFLNEFGDKCDFLPRSTDLGVSVKTWSEVVGVATEFFKTHSGVVAKAPLSLSGRGLQFIDSLERLQQNQLWIETVLKKQGEILIEPKLNRIFDYSLQINLDPKRKTLQGVARFISNERGRYVGGILGNPFVDIDSNIKAKLFEKNKNPFNFEELNNALTEYIFNQFTATKLKTVIGVDCFVYQDTEGKLRVKPLVEINYRYNMGRLKVDLSKVIKKGCVGIWRVLPKASFKNKSLFNDAALRSLSAQHGLVLERDQITKGLLWASDPLSNGDFVACVYIAKTLEECQSFFSEQLIEG